MFSGFSRDELEAIRGLVHADFDRVSVNQPTLVLFDARSGLATFPGAEVLAEGEVGELSDLFHFRRTLDESRFVLDIRSSGRDFTQHSG